jgi:tetratricopeptide (TPR) repeat protein
MIFQANRLPFGRIIKCVSLTVLMIGVNAAALGQERSNHYKVEQLIAEGFRYIEKGDYQAALDSFDHAIYHCSVHYPRAYTGKGDVLLQLGRNEEALDAYKAAQKMGFNDPVILRVIGATYHNLGDYDRAIESTLQYVNKRPADGSGYIALAWYYSFKREYRSAVDAGLKAVRYAPWDHMSHTNLCRAYNDVRRYRDAVDSCRQALRLKPGDGESYLYLGYAYSYLDQDESANDAIEKAIVGLEELVRKNPNFADGYYLLGNAYMAADKSKSAIGPLKTAITIQPNFPFAVASLGLAYWQTRDRLRAEEQYQILRMLDPVGAEKLSKRMSSSTSR